MPDEMKPNMDNVQGELMDMIIADKSPSQISDRIKDMLFAKTADKVDGHRSNVASQTFDSPDSEHDDGQIEPEVEAVTDTSMSVAGE
tara:strand:+ start:345 stop:605 length:261 start_codon:yes stop_codon:yes gene_type:complete